MRSGKSVVTLESKVFLTHEVQLHLKRKNDNNTIQREAYLNYYGAQVGKHYSVQAV